MKKILSFYHLLEVLQMKDDLFACGQWTVLWAQFGHHEKHHMVGSQKKR